jgi:putative Holliday junction resolvase
MPEPPPPQRFAETPRRGRVAAIDYGTVRLGIAVSDPARTLASPLESYTRRDSARDAQRMQRLVEEERISLFVVGLPVHLDGRESQKSTEAREFGRWLAGVTGVGVEFFDERFTSRQAEEFLTAAKLTSKRRKQRVDMVAAQIILSSYLESGGGQTDPGGLDD